jgi:radical SAM protein with 4Fe4S-binding SPASM domain
MIQSQLEVTTSIGCPINCKCCPQEIISKRYQGDRVLTLASFKKLISTVPSHIPIIFAGVSEPFLNKETPDMIIHAYEKGHGIQAYSTLQGLSSDNAARLTSIPFQTFILHIQDALGNANINTSDEWHKTLDCILRNVRNLRLMNMGCDFISDGSDNIARLKQPILHRGRVICYRHEIPDYIVLPNGNVYFCCQTKGLDEKVGNLYDSTYQELVSRHPEQSHVMQTDMRSICHKCSIAKPWWKYQVIKRLQNSFIPAHPT